MKKNRSRFWDLFSFDWDVLYLCCEDDSTSATTLELDASAEMTNKRRLEIRRLHIELPCEMLDGDSFSSTSASNEVCEIDGGLRV